MSRGKIPIKEKIDAVELILHRKYSIADIVIKYGINKESIYKWINKYQSMGVEGLTSNGNKHYSKELKEQAVHDYILGSGSQSEICRKYGIHSKTQLQNWIKKYNGHEELKSSGTGGTTIMTKGRKSTFDERIEIVQYCIAHDHNYAETAENYQISYQQARNYTVNTKLTV